MYKKKACDRCHSIKKHCNGKFPCNSCSKSNLQCSYNRSSAKKGRPRTKPEKVYRTLDRLSYSHNGCHNCKLKKKKCDESWPTCGLCHKLNLRCLQRQSYRTFSGDERLKGQEGDSPCQQKKLSNTPSELYKSIIASKETNEFDLGITSVFREKENFLSRNFLSETPSETAGSIISEHHHTFSISRNNGISSKEVSRYKNDEKSYFKKKKELISEIHSSSYKIPKTEVKLLCYFIDEVASVLFIDKTSTIFLEIVIPLCLEDYRVRIPLVTIAASHRANTLTNITPYKREAVLYKAKSQNIFWNEDKQAHKWENLVLGFLLLAMQDILEGNSLYWNMILKNVADILHQNGGIIIIAERLPIAAQLFCYLDLISSLSTCEVPYLETQLTLNSLGTNEKISQSYIEGVLNSKFGFRFGMGGELFRMIGSISTLASLRSTKNNSKEHRDYFESLATKIDFKLQEWDPPLDDIADSFQITAERKSSRLQ